MTRQVCLAALILALSACGFRPLYADAGFDGVSNSQIQIDEVQGRSGYLLRRELLRQLAIGLPGLEERARLTVTVGQELARVTLLNDGSVSRSFLEGSATYALTTDDGTVYDGRSRVQVPITPNPSLYGDVAAQTQSAEQGMRELARQIVDDLRIQVEADS